MPSAGKAPDSPIPPTGVAHDATRHVCCFGHRGARGRAPENTLLAFRLAFELGADAIECDVQRSRDSALVIIHDGTVDRTTDGSGWVAEMSFAELRALHAGRGERIPTLAETLALVRTRGGGINLEVKGESVAEALGAAEAAIPLLDELEEGMRERLLVSSFAHPAIALLKARLPWLHTGALFGDAWRGLDLVMPTLALGAEAIHPGRRLVTPELVRRAHDAGLKLNVWTVNRTADMRRLIACGVDGIFSDYPERVVAVRG